MAKTRLPSHWRDHKRHWLLLIIVIIIAMIIVIGVIIIVIAVFQQVDTSRFIPDHLARLFPARNRRFQIRQA